MTVLVVNGRWPLSTGLWLGIPRSSLESVRAHVESNGPYFRFLGKVRPIIMGSALEL